MKQLCNMIISNCIRRLRIQGHEGQPAACPAPAPGALCRGVLQNGHTSLRNRSRLRHNRTLSDNRSTIAQEGKDARMSDPVTMRVKVHDFEGTKHGAAMLKAGCHWFKFYQRDGDEVLKVYDVRQMYQEKF